MTAHKKKAPAAQFHPWTPADSKELTAGVVFQIAWQIREGNADPEQAKRLLRAFLGETETGVPAQKALREDLLEFFREAFRRILSGQDANLALGLSRGNHRPPGQNEQRDWDIAYRVLLGRIRGKTQRSVAVTLAAEDYRGELSYREIETIAAKHRQNAFVYLSLNMRLNGLTLTDTEQKRLTKIQADESKRLSRFFTE